MKRLIRFVGLATIATAVLASSNSLWAQANGNQNGNRNRGNRDPAQFLERRMQRYRDQLEVKSDDEWKAIQPLIEKVLQAQRESRVGGFGFGGGRGGRRNGAQPDGAASAGGRGNRGGRFAGGGEPNPDAVALRSALDSNAPASEIKADLAKLRDTRKQKEADLAKAQETLRQVLTARQEAIAVLDGLLH